MFKEEMKEAWWNHFIQEKNFWPRGFTMKRLERVKDEIMKDYNFWFDILIRHGGNNFTPVAYEQDRGEDYLHLMGNMAAMLKQSMVEKAIIRPDKVRR